MPEITDEEYAELQILRRRYGQDSIRESIQKMEYLEQDIDLPIRRCVAAFALLRCQPQWSCCGFDYEGQPLHKNHQYGRIFIILNSIATPLCEIFCRFNPEWKMGFSNNILDFRIDFQNPISQWNHADSVHFYEPAVVQIQRLEEYLMSLSSLFEKEVVLLDTNGVYRSGYTHWQYPALKPWVVRKSELL